MKIVLVASEGGKDEDKRIRILCSAARAWPDSWEREVWFFRDRDEMDITLDFPVNYLVDADGQGCRMDMMDRLDRERRPDVLLFYGDSRGEEWGTRLGVRLGCMAVNGVNYISWGGDKPYIKRDIYSYNLTGVFPVETEKNIFIIAPSAYEADENKGKPEHIQWRWNGSDNRRSYIWKQEEVKADNGLDHAKMVLACGRGAEDKDTLEKIRQLAAGLSGVVGGTRPFVLDGWAGSDCMVGISGHITAPKLCLVFGASGAAPFMLGVNKSRQLIGINHDPQAMLFYDCDAGVVGDCGEIAEELLKLMG